MRPQSVARHPGYLKFLARFDRVWAVSAASREELLGFWRWQGVTPRSTIEARRRQLHLDKPVLVRYGMWARGAVHGDFGRSFVTGERVGPMLWRAIGVTMRLLAGAVLLAVLFGILIGVGAALRQYSKFDYLATLFAFVFFSMPVFWLAAVLKDFGIRINQALGFNVFFTVGEQTPGLSGGFLSVWGDRLGHLRGRVPLRCG